MRIFVAALGGSLLITLLSACAGNSVFIHTARATDDGRIWVAGTRGVAGYIDDGVLHRVSYPRDRRASRYAYSAGSSNPVAQVIIHAGEPYIITRIGEVIRWEHDHWTKLPVELPESDGRDPYVRRAVEAPDGRILIQIIPNLLVWASAESFASGEYEVETCPQNLSHLTFLRDGSLHAVGWENNSQVLRRRDGPGRWPVVAHLLPREQTVEIQGIIDLGQGQPAVVTWEGLLQPAGGQVEVVSPVDFLRRVGVNVSPAEREESHFRRVIHVAGGDPLIWIVGPSAGVVGRLNGQDVFWACNMSYPNFPIGAVALESRTLIIGHQGSVSALVGETCHSVASPQLNRD